MNDFWRRRVKEPILAQLTQGVTPEKLALTCALGGAIGVFPILGSTTLLCLLVGIFLKLNQPAIQAVNYVVYPFQLGLLPVFVRLGEKLYGAEPVPLFPTDLIREFMQGPDPFLSKYGRAGIYAITAWALIAPVFVIGIYFPLRAIFKGVLRESRGQA